MCKVKFGVNLNNESDLQNMVIGIILRQNQQYREKDILNKVMYYSKNANIDITTPLVRNMVRENLNFLLRNQKVCCMDGVYTPLKINNFKSSNRRF